MQLLKTYIIEDSPVVREELIATLEELAPVTVVGTAGDEVSAVEWLGRSNHAVDLVIVDIFLRGGSGLGLLRATGRRASGARLVVLSNFASPDIRRRCLELGAHAVFDKSHDIDTLITYCRRLARGETVDDMPATRV